MDQVFKILHQNKMYELHVLLIFLMTGISLFFALEYAPWWYMYLSNYLTGGRVSNINSFFAIKIGIYITVWSIFATSTSKWDEGNAVTKT